MISIVVIWIIFSLYGVRSCKNKGQKGIISMQASKALKGICALEIMIGHIGIATESIALYPNRKAGVLFVGVFFLLSGYGLAFGVDNKKNYLNGFLKKHIVQLFIPVIMVHLLFMIIQGLCGSYTESTGIGNFFQSVNWYVWEITVLYIIFWLVYRKGISSKANIILLVLITVFIIAAYIGGLANPWYGSTYCFLLGIVYYHYEPAINKMVDKKYYIKFICLAIVCVIAVGGFFVLGKESFIGNAICRNVASLAFAALLIVFLNRYCLGNKLIMLISDFSYEVFLIHPYIIQLMKPLMNISCVMYAWGVCIVSIAGAYVVHKVVNKINNMLKRVTDKRKFVKL